MTEETFVIIGAGHAGGRAAQSMRQHGFTGQIKLIGEESYPPYERPPLSKELLYSDEAIEKAQLHDLAWYDEQKINLILENGAQSIDREAKVVVLTDNTQIPYSKLLLTTGARVRKLPLPGAELDGVFYLRNFGDTLAIRYLLQPGVKVVVIGGGFIGLESAASAAKRGCNVTVLEAADNLMGRSVAPEIGTWFAEMHRANGVKINTGVKILSIDGEGAVSSVTLEGEPAVEADLIIIGIGIIPNTELAEAAGLEVDNGIVVDTAGRTSSPDIFAAGDVANQPNAYLHRRIRLESYQNAQDQAMAVARTMCGAEEAYEDTLWVWSDQHDVNLQMTGVPDNWDELVWRGDPADGSFMVFYMRDGDIIAVNTINSGRDMRAAQKLMHSGKRYTADQLSDVSVRLLKLAKE